MFLNLIFLQYDFKPPIFFGLQSFSFRFLLYRKKENHHLEDMQFQNESQENEFSHMGTHIHENNATVFLCVPTDGHTRAYRTMSRPVCVPAGEFYMYHKTMSRPFLCPIDCFKF